MPVPRPPFVRRTVTTAACLVALVVSGTSAATAAPSSSPSTQAAAAAPTPIDPANQDSVAAAFSSLYLPAVRVEASPVTSAAATSCEPGLPQGALQEATLTLVNFFRGLSGVQPVRIDSGMSAKAQQAALIAYANQRLDHDPEPGVRCYTPGGAEASARSLLAGGFAGSDVVRAYMDEETPTTATAAHRWFIQNPAVTKLGNGNVGPYSALWLGGDGALGQPAFTSWPSAGFFPDELEPAGRWSFTAWAPGTALDRSTVRVTGPGGQSLPVRLHPVDPYGSLVFDVGSTGHRPGSQAGTYTVTVSNIVRGGTTLPPHRYEVRLFDATLSAASPTATPTPSPAATPSPSPDQSPSEPPTPAVPQVTAKASSISVGKVALGIQVRTAAGLVPAGSVTIREGSAVLARSVPLTQGKLNWSRGGLKSGRHSFTISYSGTSDIAAGSTTLATSIRARAKPSIAATAISPSRGKVRLSVEVKAAGLSNLGGKLTIKEGSRTRKAGITVRNGKATWSARRVKAGKHTYTVVYSGTSEVLKRSVKKSVTVKK